MQVVMDWVASLGEFYATTLPLILLLCLEIIGGFAIFLHIVFIVSDFFVDLTNSGDNVALFLSPPELLIV